MQIVELEFYPLKEHKEMSVALTVFGVAVGSGKPIICYVMLRSVRGSGAYPKPNLPSKTEYNEIYSTVVPNSTVKLLVWERVLSNVDEIIIGNEMAQGRLSIPIDCPVAGGQIITGAPFGPILIEESAHRANITGVGYLCRKGIAGEEIFTELLEEFNEKLTPGTSPRVLQSLILKVGELSGIGNLLEPRQVIGVVDFFYRRSFMDGLDGPLFEIFPVRPNFRTKEPVVDFDIRRRKEATDQGYMLNVTLRNYDELLKSTLIYIAESQLEVRISAPAHITDIVIYVFDGSGNLVDQINNQFCQSVDIGLSASGVVDLLPLPFPGAKNSADLEARPKIVTSSFEAASIANRSGGLDILRTQATKICSLIGNRTAVLENIWFERGIDGQLEVIRWIKKKIEQPGVSEAYLVDPFLGSEAFSRVVVRQGNQSAALNIIVSPGRKNPDSDSIDDTEANGVSDYLEKLKSTASSLDEKLAGRISIFNIKRGGGAKQAFHDRYICIINNKGVPAVYLLSNSLSKAAGAWPFAISALSQVISWRVYAYILELVRGDQKSNEFISELIWDNSSVKLTRVKNLVSDPLFDTKPVWVVRVNEFLFGLREIIIRNSKSEATIGVYVTAFLADWPEGVDIDKFGAALFEVSSHRDAVLVFVSRVFRSAGQVEIANILDEKMLAHFLEGLPRPDYRRISFIPCESRSFVFSNLSATILRKPNATNFVLKSLNTRMCKLVSMIETQRYDYEYEAHEAGLMLSIIALEIAASSAAGSLQIRAGLTADYIHWIGRLMRSNIVSIKYRDGEIVIPEWSQDLLLTAQRLAEVRRELGSILDPAFARINNDPWVSPFFKSTLASSLAENV
jgi:hypothetical protein